MRNRFDEQLYELNREIIEMGAMCEEAIAMAAKALRTGDMDLARTVKENGTNIDQMERDIEGHCMKLLLHQQPVACDLRQISAALKMLTDMERIGDQAEDIAEIIMFLKGHTMEGVETIEGMARETIKMVTESIDAFVKKDVALAEAVLAYDDVVDDYFDNILNELCEEMKHHPENLKSYVYYVMIIKYVERMADHATNMAEWNMYMITGEMET